MANIKYNLYINLVTVEFSLNADLAFSTMFHIECLTTHIQACYRSDLYDCNLYCVYIYYLFLVVSIKSSVSIYVDDLFCVLPQLVPQNLEIGFQVQTLEFKTRMARKRSHGMASNDLAQVC